jgi:hypothetical protein
MQSTADGNKLQGRNAEVVTPSAFIFMKLALPYSEGRIRIKKADTESFGGQSSPYNLPRLCSFLTSALYGAGG